MNLENFLILSGALFTIGLYGAVTKRSLVTVLMCIELMFNGVNIAAVAFSRYIVPNALADNPATTSDDVVQFLLSGQVFAIFIITVAAAEVALGLAIVIAIYRNLETVDIGRVSEMKY